MLLIRIELWSARTGQRKELGCAAISNVGGSRSRGNYGIELHRSFDRLKARKKPWRTGRVTAFPRLSLGPWDLLMRGLLSCIYDRNKTYVREGDAAKGLPGASGVYAPDSGGEQRVARNPGPQHHDRLD